MSNETYFYEATEEVRVVLNFNDQPPVIRSLPEPSFSAILPRPRPEQNPFSRRDSRLRNPTLKGTLNRWNQVGLHHPEKITCHVRRNSPIYNTASHMDGKKNLIHMNFETKHASLNLLPLASLEQNPGAFLSCPRARSARARRSAAPGHSRSLNSPKGPFSGCKLT